MRYVYVVPRYVNNAGSYEVKRMADIRQATPEHAHSQIEQQQEPHLQLLGNQGKSYRRSVAAEERRKVGRRIIRQRVLVELRSGTDRRRRNLRGSDIVEHIDIKA